MKLVKITSLYVNFSDCEGDNNTVTIQLPALTQISERSVFRLRLTKAFLSYDWPAMSADTFSINGTEFPLLDGSPTVLDLQNEVNGLASSLVCYFDTVRGRFTFTNKGKSDVTLSTTAVRAFGMPGELTVPAGRSVAAPNQADVRAPYIVQIRLSIPSPGYQAQLGELVQTGLIGVVPLDVSPFALKAWEAGFGDVSFVEIQNIKQVLRISLEDAEENAITPITSPYLVFAVEEWLDDEQELLMHAAEQTRLKKLGLLINNQTIE